MSEIVMLSKEEIGEAIVNYIGIFKKGKAFFPFYITGTDQELHLPNDVMFYLEYVPRGSKEVQHKL